MFNKRKILPLIIITISGVILLGGIWTHSLAGVAKITKVTLTDDQSNGYIETDLEGQVPIAPQYNDGSGLNPMKVASAVYICPSEPDPNSSPPTVGDMECQKVVTATFGAGWNTWVLWGGRWFYFAP